MKATNTININGKTYDARTGELVSEPSTHKKETPALKSVKPSAKVTPKQKTSQIQKRGNGFVDGLARHPQSKQQTVSVTKKIPSQQKAVKPVPAQAKKPTIAHTTKPAHRALSKSGTLNRSGVKKPTIAVPDSVVSKKTEKKNSGISPQRLQRANEATRSAAISRFSASTIKSGATTSQPTHTSAPLVKPEAVATVPIAKISSSAEKLSAAQHSKIVKHQLITESLASVHTAPTQKKHKSRRHGESRIFHFAVAGLTALVLAGYVAYLNVPSLSMKFASSRAGFAASMPSETPAGYGLSGPIAYSPGQVVINFGSNTDDRRFSIRQQPTTWDSASLKENYVAKNSTVEPLTYQDRGLTIYIFNGGDAAWVNGGKFYSIKAENSQLDTKQILELATSM
ncbi:hypothetical protein KBD20_01605 [Candidatus Saccharibacteria bacterium]|nr:hypothetical protein [Candidatus Saccharibacteria bacterium]